MKLCWIVPDDRGGGVISVASSLCSAAAREGHDVTLLMLLEPTGWIGRSVPFKLVSLCLPPEHSEAPRRFKEWLDANSQDVVFFNSCEEADPIIPFVRTETRCVYVVHDTAARFWAAALKNECDLEMIAAVSETVAKCFRNRMRDQKKLVVLENGSAYPPRPNAEDKREDRILFMGGDNPTKGAEDMLRVWPELVKIGAVEYLDWFGHVGERFRKRVQELEASERITLHGRTTQDAIFQAAAKSKAIMMLSRVEPFGMATIEGMSMGAVPVAWDIPTGTREIADDSLGKFARLGDYKALAGCVRDACLSHSDLAAKVMQRARMEFSDTAMWHKYADAIKGLETAPKCVRRQANRIPEHYKPRFRFFYLMPPPLRKLIKLAAGRIPAFGYAVRDLRGV